MKKISLSLVAWYALRDMDIRKEREARNAKR